MWRLKLGEEACLTGSLSAMPQRTAGEDRVQWCRGLCRQSVIERQGRPVLAQGPSPF